jgi:hypothetical protein
MSPDDGGAAMRLLRFLEDYLQFAGFTLNSNGDGPAGRPGRCTAHRPGLASNPDDPFRNAYLITAVTLYCQLFPSFRTAS